MNIAADDHEPRDQQIIGERFHLEELLGRGFSGRVYRATDLELGCECALRILEADTEGPLASYGQHLQRLSHELAGAIAPSLLVPYYFARHQSGQRSFIVIASEMLNGMDLEQRLRETGPLSPRDAVALFEPIARGLIGLHKLGYVHGDVKPANVIVVDSREPSAVLIDFGMVQPVSSTSFQLVGTYSYMHPELKMPDSRASGSRGESDLALEHSAPLTVDAREHTQPGAGVDIFALGQSIYFTLVGDTLVDPLLPRVAGYTDHANRHVIAEIVHAAQAHGYADDVLGPNGPVQALARLLIAMLEVPVSADWQATQEFYESLVGLASRLSSSEITALPVRRPRSRTERQSPSPLERVVADIGEAAMNLEARTYLVTARQGVLRINDVDEHDELAMQTLSDAHAIAKSRTRLSWLLGIGLTMLGAITVVGLAGVTVWAAATGRVGWSVLFGSGSVASLLGTLHFAPYDRVFRATVLATEIDMVYVRVVTVFQGTTDLTQRSRALREADATLRALLSMPLSGATQVDESGGTG